MINALNLHLMYCNITYAVNISANQRAEKRMYLYTYKTTSSTRLTIDMSKIQLAGCRIIFLKLSPLTFGV